MKEKKGKLESEEVEEKLCVGGWIVVVLFHILARLERIVIEFAMFLVNMF